MGLLDLFRKNQKSSASVAKERLQILVAHERSARDNTPSYLPRLKEDLLKVIRRYVDIEPEQVQVTLDSDGNQEFLELNIALPDDH